MSIKHKLSLVAQYDELTRNRSILSAGDESEFLAFVINQEECRKRWAESEKALQALEAKNKICEQEKLTLDTKLKHARKQINYEMEKRKLVEKELEQSDKQILLVRELLTDKNSTTVLNEKDRERLAFLSTTHHDRSPRRHGNIMEESNSVLSPSDISYDKTEDLDDFPSRPKRPSAPPLEEEEEQANILNQNIDSRKVEYPMAKRHRRSKSADLASAELMDKHHHDYEKKYRRDDEKDCRERRKSSPYVNPTDVPASPWPAGLQRFNSGSSLTRPHFFIVKTIYNMSETCFVCNKKLRFGKEGSKCRDCKIVCHLECKDIAPLPCSITGSSPNLKKNIQGTISDYSPVESPFIPMLIIYCINEIEHRGLTEQGIYRMSGSDKEVKELKEKFLKGKTIPNLSLVSDIHVVCGCLKDFLRGLKEPLVTYDLWSDFIRAAEMQDRQERMTDMYQAISQLPLPNRDTIAFLIIHLQRVSESIECKMPTSNICRVFGPTVIGFSTSDPDAGKILSETPKQAMVMEALMAIGSDYWRNFVQVGVDARSSAHYVHSTPAVSKLDNQSKFTKITTNVTPSAPVFDLVEQPRWFTNNYTSNNQSAKKTANYFASPTLR